MRKKIFTFLLALVTSVGLSWATTITWDASKVSSMAMIVESGSNSKTSDGIKVTAVSTGEFVVFGDHGGAIEIGNGEGSGGGYLTFTSSVGNITRIDINHWDTGGWSNANAGWPSPYYETFEGGTFTWSGTPAASVTLTGDAPRYIWGITSIEFTIEDGGGSTPTPSGDGGKLSGAFSVASGTQVYFSQGNLQYQASTNTWRFAEHQYDFIGDAAGNTTASGRDTQSDWIDLFGWATSGNSASGTAYQPWTNSAVHSEYGPAITSGDWTYANSDWGINPISNGGNTASSWRTLSQAEWHYLLFEREGNRFAYASLNIGGNYIYGLIILPDDWNTSYYALGSINETNHSYDSNQITAENWTNSLEAHGAVFLPITGSRNVDQIYGIDGENSYGLYWSSTAGEYYEEIENEFEPEPIVIDIKNAAYALQFAGGYYIRNNVTRRATGVAVRLVAETSGGSSDPDPQDPQPSVGDYTISLDIAENADKVTLSAASADAGETITVTPAEGYQITSLTASSGSGNSAVRFTSDPNESVDDAEPQYVTLPYEFTADVTPGDYGASFVDIEGGEGQIEFVGMNAANDQLTFRVNGTFSGTAAVHYQYKEGGWKISAIRVICAAEGGGSEVPSVKDDVTGAYSFTMPAGNVTITATVEAIPAPSYIDADFAIDFRTDPYTKVGGGDLPAGVLVEGSMNTGDAQHGYRLPVITIPVTAGNYKVMMGTCSYSNQDATVKTEDGSHTYATLATNNGTCYHNNTTANVVGAIFNVPTDQIIKVYGAEYTPFFSIKKMPEIPAFTDFEINFQSDPYNVISGAKPEGTVIIGTYHDNLHGYQNVEAVVPVEAGNYRLTVGACQYGTPGNVMSETNAELASFNSNLGEGNCYHNNTAENIVSTIFTVDMDQTITINGGAYMPYMKLEAVTAYQVSFALSDAEGTAPATVDVTVGEGITMPVNKTMYKEGYTLTGWSDGVNTYPIGESFTPANDVVLTPVFTANEAVLLNASTDVTVKWYFGGDNGAPDMHLEGSAGLLVAQATIGDKTVDVKLGIDATSGKFVPQPTTEWAQVRVGTIFTYPYKEGMTVDVYTYSGNVTYYIADGNVTCGTNDYYSYLEIVYPASASAVVIGDPNDADQVTAFLNTYEGQTVPDLTIDRPVLNNMYNTLCLPFHMDADQIANSSLNGVEIYEFVDADVTNNELYLYTSEEKHEIVAGRPYLVKFSAASQLDELNFIDVVINNADLDNQAVTIKGVTFKGTFQPIVLGAQTELNFNGGHLFLMANNTLMWPNTNNPLKPFRAYFTVNVDAGQSAGMPVRRGMPAHIGGPAQIPTGVENVQGDNVQSTKVVENGVLYIIKNGVKYNAQGQVVK